MFVADHSSGNTAIRTGLGAIFVSMELSRSSWMITSLSPGGGEKMSKHVVRSGDVAGLLGRFSQLKHKARNRTGQVPPLIVIQEAGLDGLLATPCAAERRHRNPCRRSRLDRDVTPASASEDRQ